MTWTGVALKSHTCWLETWLETHPQKTWLGLEIWIRLPQHQEPPPDHEESWPGQAFLLKGHKQNKCIVCVTYEQQLLLKGSDGVNMSVKQETEERTTEYLQLQQLSWNRQTCLNRQHSAVVHTAGVWLCLSAVRGCTVGLPALLHWKQLPVAAGSGHGAVSTLLQGHCFIIIILYVACTWMHFSFTVPQVVSSHSDRFCSICPGTEISASNPIKQ